MRLMHRRTRTGRESTPIRYNFHLQRSLRYLLVALSPLVLCWILIIMQSHKWAMSLTEQNAVSTLEKNVLLIEQSLNNFEQNLYKLSSDATFNENYQKIISEGRPARTESRREINAAASRYFWSFDDINSLNLLSSSYSDCFFDSTSMPATISLEALTCADEIRAADGAVLWIPTAKYYDIIYLNDRYSRYFSDYDVITLGLQMKQSYVKYGQAYSYQSEEDQPILLLTIRPSIFDQWLKADRLIGESDYRIYTGDGHIVYSTFDEEENADLPMPVLADMDAKRQFGSSTDEDNHTTIVCSRVLNATGWIITSYTRVDSILLYFSASISYLSLIAFVIAVLMVVIVVQTSMRGVVTPLELLSTGLDQTANGNYAHRILSTSYPNYRAAFNAYNSMNEHIDKLITENYETKLSEKELEIQVINMQFNPHFLYNMLNTISLMALEEGQQRISDMLSKLSYMMRYSVKTNRPLVPFSEDLRYIESYIAAMQLRTDDNFIYEEDVDPEILEHLVPKFILQPFVENAILHGFVCDHPDFVYRLRVSAKVVKDDYVFTVEDNGQGFDQQKHDTLWQKNTAGIGIANTNKRIQLYYGPQYGVSISSTPKVGTVVTVRIPRSMRGEEAEASD